MTIFGDTVNLHLHCRINRFHLATIFVPALSRDLVPSAYFIVFYMFNDFFEVRGSCSFC